MRLWPWLLRGRRPHKLVTRSWCSVGFAQSPGQVLLRLLLLLLWIMMLWLLMLLWLHLLLQSDGHTHVSNLQMMASQAVELGCAFRAAGRPTLAEHKEGVLWRNIDGHFALLLPHSEVERHKTWSLLAGTDVHHHAGVDLKPPTHLSAPHKVLSLQVLHTLQFPSSQLDNSPLHEVWRVGGGWGRSKTWS